MSVRARVWALGALRGLSALLPLAWIASRVDGPALLQHLEHLSFGILAAATSAPLLAMVVASLRWQVLLRGYGAAKPPRVAALLGHVLVGAYFNLLPGAVAGDALRAFRTKSALGGTVDSFTVVFVERLAGLVGLVLLGLFGLLVADASTNSWTVDALLLGGVLALGAALAVLFGPIVYRRVRRGRADTLGAGSTVRWRVARLVDDWVRRVPPPRSVSKLVWAVLLSLLTQGVTVLQNLVIVSALAPEVPLTTLLPLLPLVVFLTYFPITPAAVGQRELVYMQTLGAAGVTPEAAVSTSLIVFAALLCAAGVGGVVYLVEGPRRRASVPPRGTPSWFPPANPSSSSSRNEHT